MTNAEKQHLAEERWKNLPAHERANTQQRGYCTQSYRMYVGTMKVYNFSCLSRDEWQNRQIELHGYYKEDE